MSLKQQYDEFDVSVDAASPRTGRPVPNKFPIITNVPYKLAIIGDFPGADEEREGIPFLGVSGRFLNGLLAKKGIIREACFLGYVSNKRPTDKFNPTFSMDELDHDLAKFKPNLVLLLGKHAFSQFHDSKSLDSWRGSVFVSTNMGYKCLASYSPSECQRVYHWTPLLAFDLGKAKQESFNADFSPPERLLMTKLSVDETLAQLHRIKSDRPTIAIDIEGYVDAMSCISIARSKDECFIVPFTSRDGRNYYDNPDDERAIWRALADVLADPSIPKVLQNSLYDRFVLQYSYSLVVRGVVDDTMLKHHENYCELDKDLGFLCSLYTKQPFYKSDRKSDDRDTFWRYCCMDSAVTHEINSTLDSAIKPGTIEYNHYRFNVGLLNPILYMECRGIKYDIHESAKRLEYIQQQIDILQYSIDVLAGYGMADVPLSYPSLIARIKETMCFKRDSSKAKKKFEATYPLAMHIAGKLKSQTSLLPQELGFLGRELGISLNTKGDGLKDFLYGELKLPKQYAIDPKTKEKHVSTNYESLLRLTKLSTNAVLPLILDMGELRTRAQMLSISADTDGRIRCGYNVVGTETGRLTCYTSPTGSGYNLQTIPSENHLRKEGHPCRNGMRDLFIADDGYYLFQCDLSGADGWTVAARLASLGDSTMLDDYKAGIKPAKVLCYLLRHGAHSLQGKTREEIKNLTKSIEKESWDYFASKIGQHGTSYLMGPSLLARQVFIQSEGTVNITDATAESLQNLFKLRYRVQLWHGWMTRHLAMQPYPPKLVGASGMVRKFFGRSSETKGQALAHEPQVNTTYATNLAADRLWKDPENRMEVSRGKVSLRIQPLHQVHDALLGQFRIEDTAWAVNKIKSYFDNEIIIAGIKLVIPFEGNYGTNWALDKHSKKGDI